MKHKTNFKVTIEAKNAYVVKRAHHKTLNVDLYVVYDGEEFIFTALPRTFMDFVDDMAQNECAYLQEVFEDKNGRMWLYWNDYEAEEDYLTPAPVGYLY